MKFQSIKEYFYKLNTIGFILLLIPLALFIFLYYYAIRHNPPVRDEPTAFVLLISFSAIGVIEIITVGLLWNARINKIRKYNELASRMDGYFSLMLLKMAIYCGCFLMMAAGYFLTGNSLFTALFLVVGILLIFQWPSPSSFCRHFNLQGSERDMVIHNRDLYARNRKK